MRAKKNFIIVILTAAFFLIGTFLTIQPTEGFGEGVYSVGFPGYFLTIFGRDFLAAAGSDVPFQFSFNTVQIGVNLFICWVIAIAILKLGSYILHLIKRIQRSR
ncbi:MAG: hypothetical protein FWC66_03175 [Oscillospiraceae bacterium]|nr:hypothetical protein [Oscillospiraceae bacterium]